jgi:sphingosine kinase
MSELKGNFHLTFAAKGLTFKNCHVLLTSQNLVFTPIGSESEFSIYLPNLLNAVIDSTPTTRLTLHYYETVPEGCCTKTHRAWRPIFLEAYSDQLALWETAIKSRLQYVCRRFLVLINPASGDGSANQVWEQVSPMFTSHGRHIVDVIRTTHAGHASSIVQSMESDKYDSIAIVSGDGLMYEVVNGLMSRPDWRALLSKLTLGLIPGGSGNGCSKSVCSLSGEPFSPSHTAFIIAKGHSRPIDMYALAQEGQSLKFGVLCVSWGLISDIDAGSEKWRCCGGLRFIPGAIAGICCLTTYRASIEYLPRKLELKESQGEDSKRGNSYQSHGELCFDVCRPGCTCILGNSETDDLEAFISRNRNCKERMSDDTKERWSVLDETFSLVWALNLPDPASDFHAGPNAHSSDGCLDLVYTTESNCCTLLGELPGVASGDYLNSKRVSAVKVKALRIHPALTNQNTSLIMADGEHLPQLPMETRVFRKIVNFFCF